MAKVGFSFDGRIIAHLGSNSISSDSTAILELIKNSIDANAKNIDIKFSSSPAMITVYDDGDGMSSEDIEKKWMVIGSRSRIINSKRKNGKNVFGEKGIGRLACQKLAKKTRLITIKKSERTEAVFDWSAFDRQDVVVEDLQFELATDYVKGMQTGVTLELTGLNSKWTDKKINEIKEEISFYFLDIESDNITVTVDDGKGKEKIDKNSKHAENKILNKCPYKFSGKYDGDVLTLKVNNLVIGKDHSEKLPVPFDFGETELGKFEFEIYHFPRGMGKDVDTPIEKFYQKNMGMDNFEKFLNTRFGIFLYRDGVWVKPYGGKNDWLSLEAKRVQDSKRIGFKQVFAKIHISKDTNPKIEIGAHRESIIENQEYFKLIEILNGAFTLIKDYMKDFKDQTKKEKYASLGTKTDKDEIEIVEDIGKNLKTFATKLPTTDRAYYKQVVGSLLEKAGESKKAQYESIESLGNIRDFEKNLSTLGISTSFMARRTAELFENGKSIVKEGEKMRSRILKNRGIMSEQDKELSAKMIAEMFEIFDTISRYMELVDVISKHISRSRLTGKRKSQVNVKQCWDSIVEGFKLKQNELDVKVKSKLKKGLRSDMEELVVKIDRADLESILSQFYINSLEALSKKRGPREIIFTYSYSPSNELVLEVKDNGRGIPKKLREGVWEPFNWGDNTEDSEKHGHGLGLTIVKKIVKDSYNGTCEFVDSDSGAHVVVRLPQIKLVA